MTTKFATINFALSKFYCRDVSHNKKTAFLDDFPLCPQGPPPLRSENFIFIVVSPSLKPRAAKNWPEIITSRDAKVLVLKAQGRHVM